MGVGSWVFLVASCWEGRECRRPVTPSVPGWIGGSVGGNIADRPPVKWTLGGIINRPPLQRRRNGETGGPKRLSLRGQYLVVSGIHPPKSNTRNLRSFRNTCSPLRTNIAT